MRGDRVGAWWRRTHLATLHPAGDAHWVALRAAASLTVPLVVVCAAGRPHLGVPVTFAALTSIFGRNAQYRWRLVQQLEVGAALTAAVVGGAWLGAVAPGAAVVVAAGAAVSGVSHVVSVRRGWTPHAAMFVTFAVGSGAAGGGTAGGGVVPAYLVTAVPVVAFAVLLGAAGRWTRTGRARAKGPRPAPVPWARVVGRAGAADLALFVVAPAVAGAVAAAAGAAHPLWAMLAAIVPLAGTDPAHRLRRALHRAAGTAVGVVLAAGAVALDPAWPVAVLMAGAGQAWAEFFVLRNYAVALVGITPMALIMVHLAGDLPVQAAGERLADTVLGVGVTVLLLVAGRALPRRPATGTPSDAPDAPA